MTGVQFAVLPVGTHRSARGHDLLTAGPYIMYHGQRKHLRNNRYQLSEIDSHVAPREFILSPQLGPGHVHKCYGVFHLPIRSA